MAMRLPHTFKIESRQKGQPKYPWEEWSDGSPWKIMKGVDYEIEDIGMAGLIYHHASRYGLIVTVQRNDGYIVFQFLGAKKVKHAA